MIINIIIWVLLVVSLAIILTIVLRKFPLLAGINIAQIEAERQAELKKKILSDKFKRDLSRIFNQVGKVAMPVIVIMIKFGRQLYDKLVNLHQSHDRPTVETKQDGYRRIEIILAEADDLSRKGDLSGAEHKYIEVIGLDGKNFKAYELLAENYFSRNSNDEAEQTLLHVIKLKTQLLKIKKSGLSKLDLARNYFTLGEVYQKIGEHDKALDALKQALALEPANPKYLDKIIEICIMIGDGQSAAVFYQQLEASNAGNMKLKEIKDKIKDLIGEDPQN